MLFSSVIFIFFFLPLSLAAYFITPRRFTNITLLALSLIFYYWSGGNDVLVLIGSICLNYVIALYIEKHRTRGENPKRGRFFFIVGIACNVALLLAYKYLGFFVQQFSLVAGLMGYAWNIPKIGLPVGISFKWTSRNPTS
jgi:alginate O-acetyltransferase complex protein AlgI